MSRLRFERQHRRLYAQIVNVRRIDGKERQNRVGSLGSVLDTEPVSLAERVQFWTALDQRFLALRARRPGCISEADEVKFRDRINKRIPEPRTESERRLALMTVIQRDALAAFDSGDGEAAIAEAARRLMAPARENQRRKAKEPA
jgi:hypothetical protein